MRLKNFSNYEFYIRGNALFVRNTKTNHIANPVRDEYHHYRKFNLKDDNGNKFYVTELRLAYCLLHHCSLSDIKGKMVSGTVDNPILAKKAIFQASPPDEKYKRLADFEFAFETLKRVYLTSDNSPLIQFAKQSRRNAIKTVHEITGIHPKRLLLCYDDAIDKFVTIATNATFTAIRPLFGILCKTLKEECRSRKPTLAINERLLTVDEEEDD